jgi:WD40 repeat protein
MGAGARTAAVCNARPQLSFKKPSLFIPFDPDYAADVGCEGGDMASGRERRRWHAIKGFGGCLTFSPDGRTVAAGLSIFDQANKKEEHAIILWDLDAPTERRRQFAGDWRDLRGLVFTPDGGRLVTTSNDTESRVVGEKPEKGSTRLWDVATGRVQRRYPVEGFDVQSVAVSPDGKLLAAGVSDQTIRLYDLTTGRQRTRTLGQDHALRPKPLVKDAKRDIGHRDPLVMRCLAFSPDGSILASGCRGTGNTGSTFITEVYLWDVAEGKELRHFPAHQGWVSAVSFSPDGRTLATTGPEPMIRLWDVATGREVFPQSGHRSGIRYLIVSPADATIFTAGTDGTIRHWDSTTGRELDVIARFANSAHTMAISPDGKTLPVSGYLGGRFALWSIAERREIRSLPRIEPRNPVRHVAFSPDGKSVASERRIWDTATGKVLVTFRDRDEQNNRDSNFFPIFYSPDRKQLIEAENQGVRIWDIASGREARWAVRSEINFDVAALSRDGHYLATGGVVALNGRQDDSSIHLWELASGQEVATLVGHEASTHVLTFSPDNRLLGSCSGDWRTGNDATVRIWDVATGRELHRFRGHLGQANGLAFTPDGRSVVSGSRDATVIVWDVSDLADHTKAAHSIRAEELKSWWGELAGHDARAAHRAGWALSVPSAVGFLREHIQPARSADPEGIPAANGPIAPPEVLRTLRAIAAVERIGTPEARAALEQMARGNPDAMATRDAKSALDRLNGQREASRGSSIR